MTRRIAPLLLAWATACRAPPAGTPAGPAPGAQAATAPAAQATPVSGTWRIQPLLVHLELAEGQAVPGLEEAAVAAHVARTLGAMPQVLALDPTATTYLGADQAGVEVGVRWQLLDGEGKPRAVSDPPVDGALFLAVAVHAEQAVLKGKGEVAEHLTQATLPLPAQRTEALPDYLAARLPRAVEPAVAQVLGELWVRQLPDDAVRELLRADEDWRRVVGAREAGERKLQAARPALEKLARGSRREPAVVAVAALGRLAGSQSVPVLVACVDSSHLDVADAALQALADMPAPQAREALADLAAHHGSEAVRRRASALLQPRSR